MRKVKINLLCKFVIVFVLLICLVISSVPISFADDTASVAEIEVNDINVIKNGCGEYDYDFNPETGEYDLKYFKYNYIANSFSLILSDGTVLKSNNYGEVNYNGRYYTLSYSDDQSYENRWDIGTHEVKAKILGCESNFNVNIIDSPVDAVQINNITIAKNTHGYIESDYNPDTGKYDIEWYKYNYNELLLDYSIILNDGTVLKSDSDGLVEYDGQWYDMLSFDDQSYDNQWDIGVHKIPVSILGYESNILISIVETPIIKINVENIDLVIGTNGEYQTEYDEISGEDIEWYNYNYYSKITYQVTMLDGTILYSYSDGSVEYKDEWYFIDVSDDQSMYNEWQEGTHSVTATVGDCSTTFNVNILPSPIASLDFDDIIVIEKQSGSYVSVVNNIGNGQEYSQWYRYKYCVPSYTVTLDDGTILESDQNGNIYIGNDAFSLALRDKQSYKNQWGIGTYTGIAELIGFEKEYKINVIESPVSDIYIDNVERIENTGENVYDEENNCWYHYNYDIPAVKVALNDGTCLESSNNKIVYQGQTYDVVVTDTQSADNIWELGSHNANVSVMGKSKAFKVNIIENPVESINIKDINLKEGIDGYYVADYDEATGKYDLYWFRYFYSHDANNNFDIKLKDGTYIDLDKSVGEFYAVPYVEYNGQKYTIIYTDDQSYSTQWMPGTHSVNATILGYDTSFNVNVRRQEDPLTECYGDIDFDGRMTIMDVTDIQKYLAQLLKLSDRQKVLADVNADGKINIMDVTYIQKYIARLGDTALVGVLAIG